MHKAIRTLLGEIYGPRGRKIRILYGGSVKPANARELLGLDNVDGALVGGASLKARISWRSPPPIADNGLEDPFRWTAPLRRDSSAPSFGRCRLRLGAPAVRDPSCNPS